ncbi:MAG: polysaccharide deacetylase family protein [Candidatus Firestonebacteria bacterium]
MTKFELYLRRTLVVLVFISIIFVFTKIVTAIFTPTEENSVVKNQNHTKSIALTFDDGPHLEYTYKLLDILEKNNVKATFFVVGKMVKKYPFLLNEIYKKGHEIGNHTYNHPMLTTLSNSLIIKELELSRIEIKNVCGVNVNLFRPPSGRYNNNVLNMAKARGFKTILWSISSGDYGCEDSNSVKSRVLNNPSNGDIILMHSGIDVTMKALPEIIKVLKEKGFEFKTVSELIEKERPKSSLSFYKSYLPVEIALR